MKAYKKLPLLDNKIKLICYLLDVSLPESELKVLAGIVKYAGTGSLALTVLLTKQLRAEYDLTESSFSTSAHRLEKKGLIVRHGKTVTINPLLVGLNETNKIAIFFQS